MVLAFFGVGGSLATIVFGIGAALVVKDPAGAERVTSVGALEQESRTSVATLSRHGALTMLGFLNVVVAVILGLTVHGRLQKLTWQQSHRSYSRYLVR